MTEKIQIPQHMVQQLLRGPTPAKQAPDVVEVMSSGARITFNMDAVESVVEDYEKLICYVKLKFCEEPIKVDMVYDEFLFAAKVQPRQLHVKTDSGD
jgi:hypothetical protein